MVLTFNKREIEEFYNWNIMQQRFPEQFYFNPPENYDFNPFIKLMNEKGYCTVYLTSDFFKEDIQQGCSLACYDDDEGIKVLIAHSKEDIPSNLPRLYEDMFEKCMKYENTPLCTSEDVNDWLKLEKGLAIDIRRYCIMKINEILNLVKEIDLARLEYIDKCGKAEQIIHELCDFDASLTYCHGDGHLVLNVDNTYVAPLECLEGITKENKLSVNKHKSYAI